MRRSPLRTQAVALGILIVASVVGNVSLSASRTKADVSIAPIVAAEPIVAADRDASAPTRETVAAEQSAPEGATNVVPAIYSWDPDVTFVFYRHVTKWM